MEPPLHVLGVMASQSAMITPTLRHVELFTMRGLLTVLWHVPPSGVTIRSAAIVACGGAMGGMLGPSDGLYQRLGDEWSASGVPVLRVDYRKPNDMDSCCLDVRRHLRHAVGRMRSRRRFARTTAVVVPR